jgi:dTDP-4-dehydrorhamnose reductase
VKVLIVAEQDYIQRALMARCTERGSDYVFQTLEGLSEMGDLKAYLVRQDVIAVVNTAIATMPLALAVTALEQKPFLDLLKAVQMLRLPYVHLSNSRVFDVGEGDRYKESDLTSPETDEGGSYWRLEDSVRKHVDRHIILRTAAVFASDGENLLTGILQQFQAGGDVELSLLGHSAPVNADDLARVVLALVDQLHCGVDGWGVKVWGEYHYVSSDPATCYHFAEAALALMEQYASTADVNLIGTETVDIIWQHPLLNCDKLLNTFGIKQIPWRASMTASVKAYFEGESFEGELSESALV